MNTVIFYLNIITIFISVVAIIYGVLSLPPLLRKKPINLDELVRQGAPLFTEECYVDNSMDEWDSEFCSLYPNTEEGKAFCDRYVMRLRIEAAKTMEYPGLMDLFHDSDYEALNKLKEKENARRKDIG